MGEQGLDDFFFARVKAKKLLHIETGIHRDDPQPVSYTHLDVYKRQMLGYKRLEETRRTGSDLAEKKFSDFQLLRGFSDNEALRKDYQNMQRNYVFAEEDALSFGFVVEQWKKLGEVLLALE